MNLIFIINRFDGKVFTFGKEIYLEENESIDWMMQIVDFQV